MRSSWTIEHYIMHWFLLEVWEWFWLSVWSWVRVKVNICAHIGMWRRRRRRARRDRCSDWRSDGPTLKEQHVTRNAARKKEWRGKGNNGTAEKWVWEENFHRIHFERTSSHRSAAVDTDRFQICHRRAVNDTLTCHMSLIDNYLNRARSADNPISQVIEHATHIR